MTTRNPWIPSRHVVPPGFGRRNLALLKAILLIAVFLTSNAQTLPTSHPATDSALQALTAHLATLKNVKTLQVDFLCEKRLALLDSPLESEGHLWIKKDVAKNGSSSMALRFSTEKPYVSELILAEGKTYARSQHETNWTVTTQAARPGLTAVMVQLGAWSTGDGGKLDEMYAVTNATGEKVPAAPAKIAAPGGDEKFELFWLTPTNKDLAIAIKRVTVGMQPAAAAKEPSRLVYLAIETAQQDVTRYWFYDGKVNAEVKAELFKPEARSATTENKP